MSNRKRIRIPRVNAGEAHDHAAELDRKFFNSHPDQDEYSRPATAGELRVLGLPKGTTVHVLLMADGVRVRGFAPPDDRRN